RATVRRMPGSLPERLHRATRLHLPVALSLIGVLAVDHLVLRWNPDAVPGRRILPASREPNVPDTIPVPIPAHPDHPRRWGRALWLGDRSRRRTGDVEHASRPLLHCRDARDEA